MRSRLLTCVLHAGNGALSDAVSAYNYCLSVKAHIIHNSWGSAQFSSALTTVFQAIGLKDVPVITSAGNDGEDTDSAVHYPSGFSGLYPSTVISVGAIDQTLNFATLSNYGQKSVQIAAPGISIEGLGLDDTYVVESGTSFSAPHATGVAALLYSYLQNNRSINIDTQNVASLVTGSIVNGSRPYPVAANNVKTSNGILDFPGALKALVAGLAAQGNKTTSIGGAAGIVIGLVIGAIAMFIIMSILFFAYKRHVAHRT